MRKSEEEEKKGRTRREDLGTRREGRRKDRERPLRCPSGARATEPQDSLPVTAPWDKPEPEPPLYVHC